MHVEVLVETLVDAIDSLKAQHRSEMEEQLQEVKARLANAEQELEAQRNDGLGGLRARLAELTAAHKEELQVRALVAAQLQEEADAARAKADSLELENAIKAIYIKELEERLAR